MSNTIVFLRSFQFVTLRGEGVRVKKKLLIVRACCASRRKTFLY